MALYRYIKNSPILDSKVKVDEKINFAFARKFFSSVFVIGGVIILFLVFYPTFSFYHSFNTSFPSPKPIGIVLGLESSSSASIKASSWFLIDKSVLKTIVNKKYFLSIPKLGINNALVLTQGDDLSQSLVQVPGTALIGEEGNTVVIGYSSLPQVFKNNNYMTIFFNLDKINLGDEILAVADGVTYQYRVFEILTVDSSEIKILGPIKDEKHTISLITCAPSGFDTQRLVVRARMEGDRHI